MHMEEVVCPPATYKTLTIVSTHNLTCISTGNHTCAHPSGNTIFRSSCCARWHAYAAACVAAAANGRMYDISCILKTVSP